MMKRLLFFLLMMSAVFSIKSNTLSENQQAQKVFNDALKDWQHKTFWQNNSEKDKAEAQAARSKIIDMIDNGILLNGHRIIKDNGYSSKTNQTAIVTACRFFDKEMIYFILHNTKNIAFKERARKHIKSEKIEVLQTEGVDTGKLFPDKVATGCDWLTKAHKNKWVRKDMEFITKVIGKYCW